MRKLFLWSAGLIVYVFVGYPLLLWLVSRLRPAEPARAPATPSVSLVISAFNEADTIGAKLANVAELDYPADRLEVLVVADGSDDATAIRAGERAGVVVLHDPQRRGKAAAMARGAAQASGEVLVFSDANNLYEPEALRALVEPFADDRVGVVTGRKQIDAASGRTLDRSEGLYWRYESQIKRWESRLGTVTGVAGEILAVRREAFRPPAAGTVNDDFAIAMQAAIDGWRVLYAPQARSLERASATLGDEATRRSRIVAGRWQAMVALLPAILARRPLLGWQVISHKGLRPLVPFAMAGAAVGNLGLLRRPWGRAAALGQVAFYGAAVKGWSDARAGRRTLVWYLPYYFCRVNGAAVRGLARFARGRENALWTRVRRG